MRLPLALGAIRPRPGFSPTSPHTAAGMRMEPPPSLACAIGTTPAATSAAAPPEEAPQEYRGSHGLTVGSAPANSVLALNPNSGIRDLPSTSRPVARNWRVTATCAGAGRGA